MILLPSKLVNKKKIEATNQYLRKEKRMSKNKEDMMAELRLILY
jgi:hypothetical protein